MPLPKWIFTIKLLVSTLFAAVAFLLFITAIVGTAPIPYQNQLTNNQLVNKNQRTALAAGNIPGGINVEPSYRGGVVQLDSWWESCDSNWQTTAQKDLNYAKTLGVTLIR